MLQAPEWRQAASYVVAGRDTAQDHTTGLQRWLVLGGETHGNGQKTETWIGMP